MPLQPVGSTWLQKRFELNRHILTHASYIGSNASVERSSRGYVEQVYGPKYAPGDSVMDHLEFALKYDDLNLEFFQAVMQKLPENEVVAFIASAPSSKYARKIGFLYEFLTGKELSISRPVTGNFVDLISAEDYITTSGVRNPKWRINDNLLGNREYCPMVRRTRELNELLERDIREQIEALKSEFSPEIFRRATDYLYKKETRSSYEIEHEEPSPDRMDKFIALLLQAGREPSGDMLNVSRLVMLQNAIVDPRFAAGGFRNFQTYIGQNLPNARELIHYICPPPELVRSLMAGIDYTAKKTAGVAPAVRAAVLSFGFVFIHPFEDGNGRIHRFLIHDVLAADGVVPAGMIIPLSAHMVNHRRDYDEVLEAYSKPLMQVARYNQKNNGELVVTNPQETEGYFRYPNLTQHCSYLLKTIYKTLTEDMWEELLFLQRYDEVRVELQAIVDMPDRLLNQMILFLHQNRGMLARRKREHFPMLSDEEIGRMQKAYKMVFEL